MDKKNELMIVFGEDGYIYFPTDKINCEDAIDEFYHTLYKSGINCDNLHINECVLRDGQYNDIDKWNRDGNKDEMELD